MRQYDVTVQLAGHGTRVVRFEEGDFHIPPWSNVVSHFVMRYDDGTTGYFVAHARNPTTHEIATFIQRLVHALGGPIGVAKQGHSFGALLEKQPQGATIGFISGLAGSLILKKIIEHTDEADLCYYAIDNNELVFTAPVRRSDIKKCP